VHVCVSVGSANQMNKLSLVGMQLPENIRRISTFRSMSSLSSFVFFSGTSRADVPGVRVK
jgi:hypothetical protein